MVLVTLRLDESIVTFVKKRAAKRKVDDATAWREVILRGINGSDDMLERVEQITRIAIQNLCLSQRILGSIDEELVIKAREDAAILIKKVNAQ